MTQNNQVNTPISTIAVAGNIVAWDANSNISANAVIEGYATNATAASTTTLTVGSAYQQFFTGTTTQTVKLPVVSTLVLGQGFYIINNSTGVVTVESSGGNTVQAMAAGTGLWVTCIKTTGTDQTSWSAFYGFSGGEGSGTVNSGTAGDLAYYATTGTAVSQLALGQGLAIATATLDVGGANNIPFNNGKGIQDNNSNALLLFGVTASSVNYFKITNAVTTAGPTLAAAGSDTNVVAKISGQGTGGVYIESNNGGNLIAAFNGVASSVNYVVIDANSTGNSPIIAANGSDTNVTLNVGGQGTGGATIQGTSAATPGNAAAGYVGEVISSTVTAASPVTGFSTSTAKDITSITLTAGDWDVWGNAGVTFSSGGQGCFGWSSTTSATLAAGELRAEVNTSVAGTLVGGNAVSIPQLRYNVSGSTIVYLSGYFVFTTGTASGYGNIFARRRR